LYKVIEGKMDDGSPMIVTVGKGFLKIGEHEPK
jgi:hypothetical protein